MVDVWQGLASDVSQPTGDVWTGVASQVGQQPAVDQPSIGSQIGRQLGLTGRYAVEGAMALPNMIGNAANTAINYALPDKYKLGMPSQSTSDLLTQAGLPQPQTSGERIIGDASRAVAGLGTSFGVGGALSEISPAISNVVTSNPLMQARGALGSSTLASGTKELGFGPLVQTLAGMAGGFGATRQPFTQEEVPTPISQDLRSDAKQAFDAANSSGAVFNDKASAKLPNNISDKLADTGKMNARLHGDTLSVLDDIKNDAEKGSMTLEDLHQNRQLLGQVVNNNLHPNGDLKPDAMKAAQAIDAVDEFMENAKKNPQKYLENSSPDAIQSFQKGMSLWAQSARANDIERIMQRADFSEQPATALRSGFRQLALNPKRFNQFDSDTQDLIKKAATVSMPVEVLRGLGSRLIGTIMAGTGNLVGGSLEQAASAIPRNLATQMQMNRGQSVLNNIAQPNQLMQPLPDVFKQMGTMQGLVPELQYGNQQ